MTAVLRQITIAEVSAIYKPRFDAESTREGIANPNFSIGGLEASLRDGAIMLVEDADARTLVYCYHEPRDAATVVWVNFILALSTHVNDVFLATTNFLTARGFITAKWRIPSGAPASNYAVQAATLTGATIVSGVATVALATAATKLKQAGAK